MSRECEFSFVNVEGVGVYFSICWLKLTSTEVVKLLHELIEQIDWHCECGLNVRFWFEIKPSTDKQNLSQYYQHYKSFFYE